MSESAARYLAALAERGIRAPLRLSTDPEEIGVVLDTDGREAFTVNTCGDWPDADAQAVAALFAAVVNIAAGQPAIPEALPALRGAA